MTGVPLDVPAINLLANLLPVLSIALTTASLIFFVVTAPPVLDGDQHA